MGKSSRLLFGRSNKKKQPPVEVQDTRGPDGVPLTKAEKILGTTGLSLITGAQQSSRVSHSPWEAANLHAQRPRPNYATRRDSTESSVTTFDQFLFASYKSPHIRGPEDFVYSGPTSLLAEEITDDEKDSVSKRTNSVAHSRHTLQRRSTTTLKSAKNVNRSPYQTQQPYEDPTGEQTWGKTTRTSSNTQSPEVYVPRAVASENDFTTRSQARPSPDPSLSKSGSITRRPSTAHQTPYSPPQQYNDTLLKYHQPDRRSVSQGDLATMYASARSSVMPEEHRPRTSARSSTVWKNHQPTSQPFWSSQMQEFNKVKEHIRRPPPGMKNWFDSFPELLEDSEPDSESDVGTYDMDRTSYRETAERGDAGSVKAPSSLIYPESQDRGPEEQIPETTSDAEHSMPVSPLSTRQSFHSSLHDIVERPESRGPVPPIPDAFSPSANVSVADLRGDGMRRESFVSAIRPESDCGEPGRSTEHSSQLSRASRNSGSAASEVNEAEPEDSVAPAEGKPTLKPSRRSRDSLPSRTSFTGSVKSIRTIHSMPAFRSPPSSPAYLTIPPQYTRKTPTRERSVSSRSRANTQGAVSNASQSSAQSSESGDSGPAPAARNKLIAVTEEEAAFLELMRRKKKALAKHEVTPKRQPSHASVKRPKTASGPGDPEIRQQWATVRSASTRSAKPRSTTSSALLDSFPASPTTTRWSTRSLGSAVPLSPPPTASLPTIPPVPPLPPYHSASYAKPKTPTLYARRSLGRQASMSNRLMPSIDSSLSLPTLRNSALAVPASVPTPRLSPLTLDTIRLTRPSSEEEQSTPAPVPMSDSSVSSTPPTPRSRQGSADIIIKDVSSTRGSGSSAEGQTEKISAIPEDLQKVEMTMLMPPSSHGSGSPLSSMQSPISPLSPRWNRASVAQSLYNKNFAPSPMYRESFASDKSEYLEEFADAVSTQREESSIVNSPEQQTTPRSQRTIVVPPSAERQGSSPPVPFPNFRSETQDADFLTPVPPHRRRKRPGGLSIDVTRANGGDSRRHSIGDTSRQSIASLASLRASIRVSQATATPAFVVEEIAEQVYMRPAIQQHIQPHAQSQQRRYSGYTGRESRMSINADVMAAWGELGGWSAVARIS